MAALERARRVAATLLTGSPRRWQHVQGVAARAADVVTRLDGVDRDLVVAAWLHDVGYGVGVSMTGFHPLDGARYVRTVGFDGRIARLVAHHSFARVEADLRGLGAVLDEEFPREDSPTADALCYCDMTISPDGEVVDVAERLAEIRARYGSGAVVTQFVDCAESEIVETVRRVEGLLHATQPR